MKHKKNYNCWSGKENISKYTPRGNPYENALKKQQNPKTYPDPREPIQECLEKGIKTQYVSRPTGTPIQRLKP
jgi:hypothetical protein